MSHGIPKRSSVSSALMGPVVPTRIQLMVFQLSLNFPYMFYQAQLYRPSLHPPRPPSDNAVLLPSRSRSDEWSLWVLLEKSQNTVSYYI